MTELQSRKTHCYVWILFTLTLIVPLCIGAGLTLQLGSDEFRDNLVSTVSAQVSPFSGIEIDHQPVEVLLRKIQVSFFTVLVVVFSGGVIALTLLYRFLICPMDQMVWMARRITEGNLNLSIPQSSCYEVNEIGKSFNDLSSNLQEVLLLVWNSVQNSSTILASIIKNEAPHEEEKTISIQQHLKALQKEMKSIEHVVTSFKLYDVFIVDQRALAGSGTRQGETKRQAEDQPL
ncbi:MAG: hypothetical protein CSA20_07105 [Deltaproteobacteria bacterium]|nr:MAG: hypothetical protein CSA20_07105 [Deltaproteobacteria bacterium]